MRDPNSQIGRKLQITLHYLSFGYSFDLENSMLLKACLVAPLAPGMLPGGRIRDNQTHAKTI